MVSNNETQNTPQRNHVSSNILGMFACVAGGAGLIGLLLTAVHQENNGLSIKDVNAQLDEIFLKVDKIAEIDIRAFEDVAKSGDNPCSVTYRDKEKMIGVLGSALVTPRMLMKRVKYVDCASLAGAYNDVVSNPDYKDAEKHLFAVNPQALNDSYKSDVYYYAQRLVEQGRADSVVALGFNL